MSKKLKWIFIGLGIFVVVGFVVVWWMLFTPAYTPRDAQFSSVQEREQVANNLEQKLSQFRTAPLPPQAPSAPASPGVPISPSAPQYYPAPTAPQSSGPPKVVQVEVTQREANALLQSMLEKEIGQNSKLRDAGLTDPAIAFENGQVILVAKVEHSGMKLPVSMTVDLTMGADSNVSYTIRGLRVGRLRLPDDVRQRIEGEMSKSVGQAGTFKLPDGITGLQVADGRIIVQGIGR